MIAPKFLILLSCLTGLTSCVNLERDTFALRSDAENNSLWCREGFDEKSDGGSSDWKELEESTFHVVRPDLQRTAMGLLSRRPFIKLNEKVAEKYLKGKRELAHPRFIYLVRAAAPNLADYSPICEKCGFNIHVFHSLSRKELSVQSWSLGNPTPENLAIIVETPEAILRIKGRCLSAM